MILYNVRDTSLRMGNQWGLQNPAIVVPLCFRSACGTKTISSDRSDVAPPLVACVPWPGHMVRLDQQTHATITNHNTWASSENWHKNPHQVPFPQCATFTFTVIFADSMWMFPSLFVHAISDTPLLQLNGLKTQGWEALASISLHWHCHQILLRSRK